VPLLSANSRVVDETRKSHIRDLEEFLDTARKRYKRGMSSDQVDRTLAMDDVLFAAAVPIADCGTSQWDSRIANGRIRGVNGIGGGRPVLTWNRLPTFIQQVVNEGRENKPEIKVTPADGGTDETADMYQDHIRHIEYESDSDIAFDTAREQQITCGRGFIWLKTEYEPGSFRQRLKIEPIQNQFSVVWDPSAKLYDKSDGDFWFVIQYISKDEHERRFGKDSVISRTDFATASDNPAPEWIGVGPLREQVQIADYYAKEYERRTVCRLVDGTEHYEDELSADQRPKIRQRRTEQCATIWHYIINGVEILAESKWIDEEFGIFPLWGREQIVDGLRYTFSLIRNAKDPQRTLNLCVSNIAELVSQIPKSPWLIPMGALPPNQESTWSTAHIEGFMALFYSAFDENMAPLPPPQRIVAEPPIQALILLMREAIDGIKAAMGIFDASIGAASNETSGIAIQRRDKQQDVTNFHFPDNESRTRKSLGRALVRIIAKLYGVGDNITLRNVKGETRTVPIGTPYPDQRTGKPVTHDLENGDYGVTISTGPSYTSQRQELAARDAQLITAVPELMWVFGDEYFAADDSPGSQERADRMKRAIQMRTPGLIQEQQAGQQQLLDPQVQQAMLALQQRLEATEGFAQSLHQQLETKQPEINKDILIKKMQLDSDERTAAANLDFQREKLQVEASLGGLKAGIQADVALLQQQIGQLMHERGLQHEADMQQAEQAHAQEMQAQEPQPVNGEATE
jgi:hypothetical protein